jgi:hypothetical protein
MKKGKINLSRKVRNNKVKKKRKTIKRKSTYKRKKNKNKKRSIRQKGGNLEKILAVGAGVVLTGALAGVFKDKIPFDSSKKRNKNSTLPQSSPQSSSQHPQEYSQYSTDVAAIEDGHKNLIRMAISIKPSVKKELEAMELEDAASKSLFYIQDYRGRKTAVVFMLEKLQQEGIDNLEDVLNKPWEILLVMESLEKDKFSEDNEKKHGDKRGYFLNIPSIRNTIEKIKNLKDGDEEPNDLRTVSSYAQQIIPNLLKAYFLFKFMETPDVEKKFSEFWTNHNHNSFEAAINKIELTKSKGEKKIIIPDVKEIFDKAKNEMTKIITYIDESTKNPKELIDYIKERELKLFEDDVLYPDFFYQKIIENHHQQI